MINSNLFEIDLPPRDENDSLETIRCHRDNSLPAQSSNNAVKQAPQPPPKPFAGPCRASRSCGHRKSRTENCVHGGHITEYRTSCRGRGASGNDAISAVTRNHSFLWVSLSSFYGKLLVLLTVVICVTEIVNSDVFLMQYQSFFFLYLYLGSALVIVCIYVYTIFSRNPSTSESRENLTRARHLENASVGSFGTLKKTYTQRSNNTRTSFYLRVGALLFGLATLIYTGLQISVHTTVEIPCVDEIAFVHPILQAIFTFLQMHFLFVNSQVVVEASGIVARLGFMHLVATNIAVWIQMVTLDGAMEEARLSLSSDNITLTSSFSTAILAKENLQAGSGSHEAILVMALRKGKVRALYHCLQQSTLGRTWLEAVPFIFPFVGQFCLLAAAIFYIMWQSVDQQEKSKTTTSRSRNSIHSSSSSQPRDCQWTHKGLFLGLFVFVTTTVLLVIFYVMQVKPELRDRLMWISLGTATGILIVSSVLSSLGLLVMWRLTATSVKSQPINHLLSCLSSFVVIFYGSLSAVAGGSLLDTQHSAISALLFAFGIFTVFHAGLQNALLTEAANRQYLSVDRYHHKSCRQILTALLLCNASLWLIDSFLTSNQDTQKLHALFYTPVLWGFLVRICLPVVVLNRFHSTVMLYEIWKIYYSQR